MSSLPSSSFARALAILRREWQAGLTVAMLLRVARVAAWLLLVAGLADFWLGLEIPVRVVVMAAFAGALFILAAIWSWRIFTLQAADAARRADAILPGRRHTVLSAVELSASPLAKKPRDLQGYLIGQTIARADLELRKVPTGANFPWATIGREALYLLVALGVLGAVASLNMPAARIVFARLLHPAEDLAPYSHYTFTVTPERPEVTYGGTLEAHVEIGGGPVHGAVQLLTRQEDGVTNVTGCFHEGGVRFAQKLENVTQPVQFCFTLGRARSEWRDVTILYQPKIVLAVATLTPPAYTHQPARRIVVGAEDLAGYPGTQVELTVTSNRPLSDGSLTLNATNGAPLSTVAGKPAGSHAMIFSWTIERDAALTANVRDVRGALGKEPLKLRIKATPDAPPDVSLALPGSFAYATPNGKLPLEGGASDDIGLRKVELVRALTGFRDRARAITSSSPAGKEIDVKEEIDLGPLGLEPGQTLELYLEASDENPRSPGATASDIAHVRIISDEQYAEMIRLHTTLEEFGARYDALAQKLADYDKALQHLEAAATQSPEKTDVIAEKLQEAQEAHRAAQDLFEQIAKDFIAFDTDRTLTSAAGKAAAQLADGAKKLGDLKPPFRDAASVAADLRTHTRDAMETMKPAMEQADEVKRVAALFEQAGDFVKLVRLQSDIVRRLERANSEAMRNGRRALEDLAEMQKEASEALAQFRAGVTLAVDQLPPGYEDLAKSAREFLAKLDKLGVDRLMDLASNAGVNQNGRDFRQYARTALERLQQLLSSCQGDAFGGLCQGGLKFQPKASIAEALTQMLGACMARGNGGNKPGSGDGGPGGSSDDGTWAGGSSLMEVPVFGPVRTTFKNKKPGGLQQQGKKGGGAAPSPATISPNAQSTAGGAAPTAKPAGDGAAPMQAPEKYREAVKRYFSNPAPAEP